MMTTMKIYTKSGDQGDTQLIGRRVKKSNDRVEAYGTVDELNSQLGLTLTVIKNEEFADMYRDGLRIQHELFDLGGDLANVTGKADWSLQEEAVLNLERRIDVYWDEAPPIERFILPGGEEASAHLHICRTVARRAERAVVHVAETEEVPPQAIRYLNRLSDFFFAAARAVNVRREQEDIYYERGKNVFK
ncbi:cob(I)alamin adenosyltransferase [Salisediminibacterium halotolerans]|uniref:Corrinoid adenosyltransferase n=2 Tax=Salisediminibacterium halotolerans TaxID=517425 RepID=A0A1H9P858_9BACI|nr:cob(I)alamin adenosyltransferase [Salisediminibacterium haloalkalitolerans]